MDDVVGLLGRFMLFVTFAIFVLAALVLKSGSEGLSYVLVGVIVFYIVGLLAGSFFIGVWSFVKRKEFLKIRARNQIIEWSDLADAIRKFSYDELDCALAGFRRMTALTEGRIAAICGPVTKLGILPTLLASMVTLNQIFPGFDVSGVLENRMSFYFLLFILALSSMQIYAFISGDVDGKKSAVIELVEKIMHEKRQSASGH